MAAAKEACRDAAISGGQHVSALLPQGGDVAWVIRLELAKLAVTCLSPISKPFLWDPLRPPMDT